MPPITKPLTVVLINQKIRPPMAVPVGAVPDSREGLEAHSASRARWGRDKRGYLEVLGRAVGYSSAGTVGQGRVRQCGARTAGRRLAVLYGSWAPLSGPWATLAIGEDPHLSRTASMGDVLRMTPDEHDEDRGADKGEPKTAPLCPSGPRVGPPRAAPMTRPPKTARPLTLLTRPCKASGTARRRTRSSTSSLK